MSNHYYNKNLRVCARELRSQKATKAEIRIWKQLLSRRQMGARFLRQRATDNYIVDFFSPELKLIIEVDGNSHFSTGKYDLARESRLRELGFQIIRFSEKEVLEKMDEVKIKLAHAIHCLLFASQIRITSPAPPQGGNRLYLNNDRMQNCIIMN